MTDSIIFPYKLYLVTDEAACLGRDLMWVVEEAVKGGVDIVQIREKALEEEVFMAKTFRLKEMLDKYNVPLIVNDNFEISKACDVAGIHVGNSDMPPTLLRKEWGKEKIIGYSIEEEEQIYNENSKVSTYLALSPVFSTHTKTDTIVEWGIDGIERIRHKTSKPLVAIGNINEGNARQIVEAGANCIAVVSAICSAESPAKAAERLRKQVDK